MIQASQSILGKKVGVLGVTQSSDSDAIENARVENLLQGLLSYDCQVQVHDPVAEPAAAMACYDLELCDWDNLKDLDALILAVPHSWYRSQPIEAFIQKLNAKGCLIDVQGIFNPEEVRKFCVRFWQGRGY